MGSKRECGVVMTTAQELIAEVNRVSNSRYYGIDPMTVACQQVDATLAVAQATLELKQIIETLADYYLGGKS